MREVLATDPQGLSLRTDPDALAPERLLVFELRGSVNAFATAISNVIGLEFIDEDGLDSDESDQKPVAYLLVPDMAALQQIESLWRRWNAGENLGRGFTAWRDVFAQLRQLRPWGPQDRVSVQDSVTFADEIDLLADLELLRLEIELVYRESDTAAQEAESSIEGEVKQVGGHIVSKVRIKEIGYHACLVDLPVREVRAILEQRGVATVESVMHIRPQSVATTLEIDDAEPVGGDVPQMDPLHQPILALLDGVPVANHPLLSRHLSVDDPFGLEPLTAVADRKHGTAMASLIVHGDRNRGGPTLPRKIHVLPVLMAEPGRSETFRSDRLIVDLIYQAVRSIRVGPEASAPEVIIVNLSLGNSRQPFHRSLSAWAKLLDRLAYEHGILFIVSAGNVCDSFDLPTFSTRTHFEDADPDVRSRAVLGAIGALVGQRKLFSPAETVNGITVGACSTDDVPAEHRATSSSAVVAYADLEMANPSSALGPGYGTSIKPDILMPGSREHLLMQGNITGTLRVSPAGPSRAAGLKVAAPSSSNEQFESYTSGTSAAAALASRTCHQIHDALEAAYGDAFLNLTHRHRAVLLKALLAHTAQWPRGTSSVIRSVLGPSDGRQHVQQKDNIRRFLGYGVVDSDAAIACAGDRATFWATGEIAENQVFHIPIPIPLAMANKSQPHALVATTSWFTPTKPGNKLYRGVRLKLIRPDGLGSLGLDESFPDQPDVNQVRRGTLCHQRWVGERAAAVQADSQIALVLQREPDQAGMVIDEPVPFAVAATLTMPGVVEIYDQVRQRLGIALPIR
ncbi:S8 family peptidase [Lysobacter sp. HDW10]|uniref:S8 family peptidase n=1 Tax=Lysobacter sp. HDW10 TaxID=2714936 RepID=UPI00197B5DB5|nr:S8 family peptidase [Lysobacter sp. HDW10]